MEKARILICDDEAGVRQSLQLILDRDYLLAFATNGQEAINHLKKHPTDLLISDIKMPRMSGLDALQRIKRARPRVRVLMISGYESSDVAAQAIHLGADDYLTKPFDREEVLAKIRALLSRKRG